MMSLPLLFAVVIVVLYLANCINILKEYERAVIFRLGRVK
jgi:regulator of protease activity HflC (stomatin/prohibitin superfamily)